MLYNKDGSKVVVQKRASNRLEDGFVVSNKADHSWLKGLRESCDALPPKCGKMFHISERARVQLCIG